MKYPKEQFSKLEAAVCTLSKYIDVTSVHPCTLHFMIYQCFSEWQKHNALILRPDGTIGRAAKLDEQNEIVWQDGTLLFNLDPDFELYPNGCNDTNVETAVKKAIKEAEKTVVTQTEVKQTPVVVIPYDEVTNHNELHDYITDLYDGEEFEDDILDLTLRMFEGDPEILENNGGQILFIDVDIKGIKYVVYVDSEYVVDIDKAKTALVEFYQPDFKEKFTECDYTSADIVIQYRNGQGYHYTRWIKN